MPLSPWNAEILHRPGPKYRVIADAIEGAIDRGELVPGARLPTIRDTARELEVTVGTVVRAYAEARARGLISGEIGRGSFVRRRRHQCPDFGRLRHGPRVEHDLSENLPVTLPDLDQELLAEAFRALSRRRDLADLVHAHWRDLAPRHREVGARWIGRLGMDVEAARIDVCTGFHSGLSAVFAATTKPGDLVLAPALGYGGLRSLAERYGVRLEAVPADSEGIRPDALDTTCRDKQPRLLYLEPTLHSPTTVTLSGPRRAEVAEVLRRHQVFLVEDESSGFLLEEPLRPVSAHCPDQAFLVADTSRGLGPGIRLAYLCSPATQLEAIAAALSTTMWSPVPLLAELAALWIETGQVDQILRARREELRARNRIAARVLADLDLALKPEGHHSWLTLPRGSRAETVVARAEERGVAVTPTEWFVTADTPGPEAIRICHGAARDQNALESALRTLRDTVPL
jgi:DNA-binding transcriptional MocR family regulator